MLIWIFHKFNTGRLVCHFNISCHVPAIRCRASSVCLRTPLRARNSWWSVCSTAQATCRSIMPRVFPNILSFSFYKVSFHQKNLYFLMFILYIRMGRGINCFWTHDISSHSEALKRIPEYCRTTMKTLYTSGRQQFILSASLWHLKTDFILICTSSLLGHSLGFTGIIDCLVCQYSFPCRST